jgi:hypothetical protein
VCEITVARAEEKAADRKVCCALVCDTEILEGQETRRCPGDTQKHCEPCHHIYGTLLKVEQSVEVRLYAIGALTLVRNFGNVRGVEGSLIAVGIFLPFSLYNVVNIIHNGTNTVGFII